MNNQRFNKALDEIKAIGLTPGEKAVMRTRILTPRPIRSPYAWSFWVTGHRTMSMAIVTLLVIALGGGGVASAAVGSLPGDFLYKVKVAVVEPIRGSLAVSAEAKAEWQVSRVNERLVEAEALVEQGRLDNDSYTEINSLINKHNVAFDTAVQRVEAADRVEQALKLNAELDDSLAKHAQSFDQDDEDSQAAMPIAAKTETTTLMSVEVSGDVAEEKVKPAFDIYKNRRNSRRNVEDRAVATTSVESLTPAVINAVKDLQKETKKEEEKGRDRHKRDWGEDKPEATRKASNSIELRLP